MESQGFLCRWDANVAPDKHAVTPFAVSLFPPAQALFRLSCCLHTLHQTYRRCRHARCGGGRRPASLIPRPPGGLRRPTRSCCASPLRACRARTFPPPGAPSCFIVPQSRHSPVIRVSFFVHFGYRATSLCSDAPKPGSLPIASGVSQTTAARRLLYPCGLSYLFLFYLRPVPADFALLRLPRPGVIAAVAVTRTALRLKRDTSPRCFLWWCSGTRQTRAAP